jgi:H+/Cl- antiporter ClcA
MNAELESKSMELLQWLEQAIKSTADFTAEQIPLFVQELLHYNFVMSLSYFIIGLGGATIATILTYKFAKWMEKEEVWGELGPIIMFPIALIVASILFSVHNTDWIKIKLAPRVYLMEYVKDQIKQ